MDKKVYLLLGSLPIEGIEKSYGGATILMRSLVDYLHHTGFQYFLISLNKNSTKIVNYVRILFYLTIKTGKANVLFLNISNNGAFILGPVAYCFSKVFKKKMVFRLFGSNFEKIFNLKSKLVQYIAINTFLKSDVVIVETVQNHDYIDKLGVKEIIQLPNVRKRISKVVVDKEFSKRFVFISHVKESKGVLEIIKASKSLPEDYTIDVYGPIKENFDINLFENSNVIYKGVLNPQEVIATLLKYDVILLPSFYQGEGHPGILVEAMSVGVPAISTNWNSISDVVEDGYNGFLIEIKNSKALVKAILSFSQDIYPIMSENSLKKFKEFDEEIVYGELASKLSLIQ